MKSALVGYARTSTFEQVAGLEAQRNLLETQGCDKIFSEQISSRQAERAQLKRALEYVREGDVFIVTKIDRLARSMSDLMQIIGTLDAKGVALRILSLNLDTATPTGNLMLNIMGSVAEFEREIMLERQRDGIARAKAHGKYKGRKPTAREKLSQVLQLRRENIRPNDIAQMLLISRASVYRLLRENGN